MVSRQFAQDERLASRVAELLDGRTIATAESCTAGRLAEVLATVERATDFFRGGIVAYQEWVKRDLLGVTASSVLTPEAAAQMAIGAARLMRAEVAVSTTGVAGGDDPVRARHHFLWRESPLVHEPAMNLGRLQMFGTRRRWDTNQFQELIPSCLGGRIRALLLDECQDLRIVGDLLRGRDNGCRNRCGRASRRGRGCLL